MSMHGPSQAGCGGTVAPDGGEFQRVLGLGSALAIVIGAIIGIGIFFTPAEVARMAGSRDVALAVWAGGGVIALLGALTFAELGGRYGRTGGQYEILRDAYGPRCAFVYVFCNATWVQGGSIAIIAILAARNLLAGLGYPDDSGGWLVGSLACGQIAILAAANAIGVRWGSLAQNLTVLAKLATLVLLFAVALLWAQAGESVSQATGPNKAVLAPWWWRFAGAFAPAMFAFGGWQHALWIGGEIRNPRRNIPLAIVLGVVIVIAVYGGANWAYFELLGYSAVANSRTVAAEAMGAVWPQGGARAIAWAVWFSAFGVLNSQLLSGPRLICGMARDGRFFVPFARLHPRYATPVPAIGLLAGLGIVLAAIAGLERVSALLNGVVMIDATFFALTSFALIRLRRQYPEGWSFRSPGFPLVPVLFGATELIVLAGTFFDPQVRAGAVWGLVWGAGALVLYQTFFAGVAAKTKAKCPGDD